MTCAANVNSDMPGTGRSLLAGWIAAAAAALPGGAAGGLLCACIVSLANVGRASLVDTFDPGLIWRGIVIGAWPIAVMAPAAVVLAHLATRRQARNRYAMAVGWSGFLAGGAAPYAVVPGYDTLPLGLVAGLACAWAFVQVGGRVRDGG